MSSAHRTLAASSHCPRGQGTTWWFAQWLLVLVLVLDTVSAPFHHHGHDDAGGAIDVATAQAAFDDAATHAEDDEHGLPSHSMKALRVESSRTGRLAGVDRVIAAVADPW